LGCSIYTDRESRSDVAHVPYRSFESESVYLADTNEGLAYDLTIASNVMKSMLSSIHHYSNWIVGALLIGVVLLYLQPSNKRNIKPSTDAHFQAVVAQETRPVLVKFGATWCPPCVSTDRALAEYEGSSSGEVKVVIMDVDENPSLSRHYGVRSIPHSFLFLNGNVVDDRIGGMDVQEIRAWLKSNERHWSSAAIGVK
jgi:thioredoxin 1